MVQIFESFDNYFFYLSENANEFINKNPVEAIKQIDIFFNKIEQSFKTEDSICLLNLYNSILQKEVQSHIIEKTYQYFIDKVTLMLDNQMYAAIRFLLDLFWHNWLKINWSNINRNISFLKNTYPILFCEDEDGFAEIAARFYWDLISNNKNFNDENIKLQNEFREKYLDRYNWLFPFGE